MLKRIFSGRCTAAAAWALMFSICCVVAAKLPATAEKSRDNYIKWFEFNVCYQALSDAMQLDIDTYSSLYHISWIDSLSYLAVKNSNDWSNYKKSDLDALVKALSDKYTVEDLVKSNKYFSYYRECFSAVLSGFLCEYEKQAPDGENGKKIVSGYGLCAYSPIADGFSYSHFDDFGVSRTYGYRRTHLGNDLMSNVGTPIVSTEGGTVESFGWNRYGGWRLGIRSFDGKRSYYYAHLRKDRPYAEGIRLGARVKAGQVIGYMGMTGYSETQNVNGMSVPHLHYAMQLIFDESQKEGENQIWINVYNIVKLLWKNRASVERDENGEYKRVYDIAVKGYPKELCRLEGQGG